MRTSLSLGPPGLLAVLAGFILLGSTPVLRAAPIEEDVDANSLLAELEALEVSMFRADAELRGATLRVREVEGRIADQNQEIAAVEESLAERLERMALRLRIMYRMRHRGFLPLLFSADSPHDLLMTARYLWWIVRSDQEAAEDWRLDRERSEGLRREAEAERNEESRSLRDERRALLGRIQMQKPTRVQKLLIDYRRGDLDLSMDLREEEAPKALPIDTPEPPSTFAMSKGRLPLPTVGRIERTDRGINIIAAEGKPIRAVHPGNVSQVLHISGYGLVAILDHGDGWHTVYAHASGFGVEPGDRVDGGQVIGTVGDTGSLEGPRLHFEVRNRREAHDPMSWLRVPAGLPVGGG